MAEVPTHPDPESALSKRIQGYIDSGKAWEHLQEGFNQATSGFLSLQGFKERESGRKRPEVSEGSVHQGDEISEALKKKQVHLHPGQEDHQGVQSLRPSLAHYRGPVR